MQYPVQRVSPTLIESSVFGSSVINVPLLSEFSNSGLDPSLSPVLGISHAVNGLQSEDYYLSFGLGSLHFGALSVARTFNSATSHNTYTNRKRGFFS